MKQKITIATHDCLLETGFSGSRITSHDIRLFALTMASEAKDKRERKSLAKWFANAFSMDVRDLHLPLLEATAAWKKSGLKLPTGAAWMVGMIAEYDFYCAQCRQHGNEPDLPKDRDVAEYVAERAARRRSAPKPTTPARPAPRATVATTTAPAPAITKPPVAPAPAVIADNPKAAFETIVTRLVGLGLNRTAAIAKASLSNPTEYAAWLKSGVARFTR